MQYLNSAVLMDMISVEFKAQRIAPNPTKSKLFSVLIVWPESSRKPCKIDLAYKSSKILHMNRVNIMAGFVTRSLKSYQKLWTVYNPEPPQCNYLEFCHRLQEENCHHLYVTLKQGTVTQLLPKCNLKALCTSSARWQGNTSPDAESPSRTECN